jgi:DNA-binding transcriptional LysR family regulator
MGLFVQEITPMNRLEAMQIFVRVAELSGFTRGAESLGIPKANASTAVQQLESELGTRLLHRTTRKVELTQDGRAYYERCKDLLADMDELQSMFDQSPQAVRGRLRVDMPSGVAREFIIPRLPRFLKAHPNLELELSTTDRRVDLVREGFDCVLRVGTLGDTTLIARPLGRFRIVNVASVAYLRAHGKPKTPDDLARHQLIHWANNFGAKPIGFEYPDRGSYTTLQMPGVLTVNNAEAYEAACLAGLGIIQCPEVGVRHLIAQGRLAEVLPRHRAEPMPVSLLYASRRNLSKRVQLFMAWMAETLTPLFETTSS